MSKSVLFVTKYLFTNTSLAVPYDKSNSAALFMLVIDH